MKTYKCSKQVREIVNSIAASVDCKVEQFLKIKPPVFIHINDETGEDLWSVQVKGTDFWLDSFKNLYHAMQYCNHNGLPFHRSEIVDSRYKANGERKVDSLYQRNKSIQFRKWFKKEYGSLPNIKKYEEMLDKRTHLKYELENLSREIVSEERLIEGYEEEFKKWEGSSKRF